MIAGMTKPTQAVVMGASMAGLLAACALSETFDRVVLVERDHLPDDAADRRGVPQGKHLHGLLAGGLVALNNLIPGFEADLLASGDCTKFCAALRPRLDGYAEAGVTWVTVEPASRSFGDFRADIDVLANQLIRR